MKKSFRDAVAEEMIEKLENGTAPWQKPWQADVPFNPTTNTPYKGMNSFWLEMAGYEDPRWMTYNQAKKSGAQVLKGSKSRSIEYWQWSTEHPILDENGKPIRDDEGKVQKQSVRLERPKVFHAALFNGSQIEGLEPYKAPALTFDPVVEADLILEGTNVSIVHDQKDRAFYHRNEDVIHLPDRTAFKTAYEYYATALHEVGHATGSPDRMVREKGPFGSDLYAKEELMVEMASYMMSRELGLGHYPDRHASYVDSWLNDIKEDKNYLFQAAQTSEKIRTWVMEPEKRMELERTTKLAHTHEREALEDNKSVVQGMDLTEEEKEIRLQKIIQQEEALIENYQPVFDGYDANPLSVHKPKLVDEITTEEIKVVHFNVGNELSIKATIPITAITGDLIKSIKSADDLGQQKTSSLGALEIQDVIKINLDPSDPEYEPAKHTNRIIGRIQDNDESKLVTIDFTSDDELTSEIYSDAFQKGLSKQIESSQDLGVKQTFENLKLHPQFVSSNRKILDHVANFHLPDTDKSGKPTYIQTLARTKGTSDKINQFVLASGNILDGSIPNNKLDELSKIGVGEPEISFDEETGFHKVSFDMLVYSDKKSLLSADKHGRPEVVFSSRDEKKVQQFAQTFMNSTKALTDLQLRREKELERKYLVVPFEEIVHAKAAGALFDRKEKAWYAPEGSAQEKLAKWRVKPTELSNSMNAALNEVAAKDPVMSNKESRTYLDVPFKEKAQAKEAGAKWDKDEKKWFAPDGVDLTQFDKWIIQGNREQSVNENVAPEKSISELRSKAEATSIDIATRNNLVEKNTRNTKEGLDGTKEKERVYLAVPFSENQEAKALGAKWDAKKKSWYASNKDKLEDLKQWAVKSALEKPVELNPQEEFEQFLQDHGVELKGPAIMDGKKHRIALVGEVKKKSAEYKGYLDGRPSGGLKNFKTGEYRDWSAVGKAMTEQERENLKAIAAAKSAERKKETIAEQAKAAKKAFAIWKNAPGWANEKNAEYLKDKGVKGYGIKVNNKGQPIIPLRDINGRIHNLQTITKNIKLFEKDGRKIGLMHTIDPKKDIEPGNEYKDRIIIAEGYSTAASVFEMVNKPTVVAFDGGNLKAVALEVRKKHPEAEIIIAADNDHKNEINPEIKKNTGIENAQKAAEAVNGVVAAPDFTKEEKEQGLSDWNDLDKSRGREAARSILVNEIVSKSQSIKRPSKEKEMGMAV